MIKRLITEKINKWIHDGNDALLVTGARQIGKTFLIRKLCQESGYAFIEMNFIENPEYVELLSSAYSVKDFFTRMSLIVGELINPGYTIIFFD